MSLLRRSRLSVCLVATALTPALGACGDEGGGTGGGGGSAGDELSGTVDGASWSISAAYADGFTSADGVPVVLLGGDDTGSCASPSAQVTAAKLSIRVPETVGVYDVSAAQNRELNVFIPPSTSFNVGSGSLEVLEATSTAVRATLTVDDARVTLDGEFEAELCP